MANLYQSHMNQNEDQEENKEQECSSSLQWNRDESTGIRKCKGIELRMRRRTDLCYKKFSFIQCINREH